MLMTWWHTITKEWKKWVVILIYFTFFSFLLYFILLVLSSLTPFIQRNPIQQMLCALMVMMIIVICVLASTRSFFYNNFFFRKYVYYRYMCHFMLHYVTHLFADDFLFLSQQLFLSVRMLHFLSKNCEWMNFPFIFFLLLLSKVG